MLRVISAAFAGCFLLSGCSMITTDLLDSPTEAIREGATAYSLPMTMVDLAIIQYQTSKEYDVAEFKDATRANCASGTICSEVLTVADPVHSYVVRYRGSPLSDDTFILNTDPKTGFLTKADGKAIDKTGDILVEATRYAFGDFPKPKAFADRRGTIDLVDRILLDPNDPDQIAMANRKLSKYKLAIECRGACAPSVPGVAGEGEEIFYRIPRTVMLYVLDSRSRTVRSVRPVLSYNGSPLIAQRLERAPFIERQTTIVYEGGVPKEVTHKKPSEALGFVTTVGNVAGAVVFSPVNALTAQTQALGAESQNLAAREKLLQDRTKLFEAEANYRSKYGSLPNGGVGAYGDERPVAHNSAKPPSESDAIEAGQE